MLPLDPAQLRVVHFSCFLSNMSLCTRVYCPTCCDAGALQEAGPFYSGPASVHESGWSNPFEGLQDKSLERGEASTTTQCHPFRAASPPHARKQLSGPDVEEQVQ